MLLGIYPTDMKTQAHTEVYSSFTHNCQHLEATKTSFSGWLDKQTVTHPDNGILFGDEK